MCGRYKLSTPGDELWEHFDLHGDQLPLVPREFGKEDDARVIEPITLKC